MPDQSKKTGRNTRKKPDTTKKKQGTLQPSRRQVVLPMNEAVGMTIQWETHTAEEAEVFVRISRVLSEQGMLNEVDQWQISLAATHWIKLKEAREDLNARGNVDLYENGTRGPSAEFQVYNKLLAGWKQIEGQLGLSPRSRKIMMGGVFEKPKEKKPPMSVRRAN